MILQFLRDKRIEIESLSEATRIQLEQRIHFCQFETEAKQVLSWIRNGESMLSASFLIPTSMNEAEDLRNEHEQFQMAIEVGYLT